MPSNKTMHYFFEFVYTKIKYNTHLLKSKIQFSGNKLYHSITMPKDYLNAYED